VFQLLTLLVDLASEIGQRRELLQEAGLVEGPEAGEIGGSP
jgi:hypothetical protein